MSRQNPVDSPSPVTRVRVDKWLWAARFFKTRGLAQEAVEAGRVRMVIAGQPGDRLKPSREIRVGDVLQVQVADLVWTFAVLGVSDQRGPASLARQLYRETVESESARLLQIETRKTRIDPGSSIKGRPTKKDRRQIHRFNDFD